MPVLIRDNVDRRDCLDNPETLFLFGDNSIRKGTGGQACIRGMPNAHGVRTKHLPAMTPGSFFTDDDFSDNCQAIDADLFKPLVHLSRGKVVVIPRMGIGLAKMDIKAPMTWAYFKSRLDALAMFSIALDAV